jgi:aminopeptidase N
MEDVSGRDLDWFFREWFYTTDVLDQAVDSVAQARQKDGSWLATVYLASRTPVVMPVPLTLTTADGKTQNDTLPVDVWYRGDRYAFTTSLPARLTDVVIDRTAAYPDMDRSNNAWHASAATSEGKSPRR